MAISSPPPHSWANNVNKFLFMEPYQMSILACLHWIWGTTIEPLICQWGPWWDTSRQSYTNYWWFNDTTQIIRFYRVLLKTKTRHWWHPMTIFQEDAFSSDVVAELLSREEETLAESLLTWVKAVVKTMWKPGWNFFPMNIYQMKISPVKTSLLLLLELCANKSLLYWDCWLALPFFLTSH